jgi:hypothetical protein
MFYNLRFRNGWYARFKWPCKIGWHAQRMAWLRTEPITHVVLTCACCDWKRYEAHV